MPDDRFQKLESIGFQWSLRFIQLKNRETVQWDARFQELKKYKETHGNCNVPPKHRSLCNWVGNQRQGYHMLKCGKSSPMSDDCIQKLESIDFRWSLECFQLKNEYRVQWDARFQELKKYRETHGDCNVPRKHGPLGNWVYKQRLDYRLLQDGESAHMSDDRIQKLESIDFGWSLELFYFKNGKTVQWDARFQELKKYKETHGDCNDHKRHGSLSNWIRNQRTCYRLLKEEKSASMSNDRIQKL